MRCCEDVEAPTFVGKSDVDCIFDNFVGYLIDADIDDFGLIVFDLWVIAKIKLFGEPERHLCVKL